MITRFVKMTFQPEKTDAFIEIFNASKDKIKSFPGCDDVQLLRAVDNPSVFFTKSLWNSLDDLENYRQSDLFKSTWAKTKVLFAEKPAAWSLSVVSQ